eukprot:jgi/Tetstr1/445382/TSEL_003395.t1
MSLPAPDDNAKAAASLAVATERKCCEWRVQKLKHRLPSEAWLGMPFDYLWNASDPDDNGTPRQRGGALLAPLA